MNYFYFLRLVAIYLLVGCIITFISFDARSQPLCTIPESRHYAGLVRAYIADLKSSFPESSDFTTDSALTQDNFQTILSGLVSNVGVNGIRVPIISQFSDLSSYSELYRKIYGYARRNRLFIYASPLGFGPNSYIGWSDERYASWIAAYSTAFKPDFVSPFNEAGFEDVRIANIMKKLRPKISGLPIMLVGPDKTSVLDTIQDFASRTSVGPFFVIVSSHNANRDSTATGQNWSYLVHEAPVGRAVWSSENPSSWFVGQSNNLPGLDGAVESGVKGLVVWRGKPSLIDDTGQATLKACKLAEHIIVSN